MKHHAGTPDSPTSPAAARVDPTEGGSKESQTLDDACRELHGMVDAFRAYWLRERAKNPEYFPMVQSDGQWFENFMVAATGGEGLGSEER